MIWRVGGLCVVTGLVFVLALSGAFVFLGVGSLFLGAVLLAVAAESVETQRIDPSTAVMPVEGDHPRAMPGSRAA